MDNISTVSQNKPVTETKPGDIYQKGKSTHKGDLDKDAFLKLLVTELKHQDPTNPMNDREFISQMAQFSTLEQMSSMNNTMLNMNRSSKTAEAYALLGMRVEALNPETGKKVAGTVTSIFHKDNEVRLTVNKKEIIGLKDIYAVYPPERVEESGSSGKEDLNAAE